jgi:hypothetical protein
MKLPRASRFRVSSGQITSETVIGQWLNVLAQLGSVNQIVEIGTWHGGGSTKILSDALDRRTSPAQAWCLEADKRMAGEAARRHAANQKLNVVWGSIVTVRDLDLDDLTSDEIAWSNQDSKMLANCPIVTGSLPDSIDLLLLDGGEFSGVAEWAVLQDRAVGWILLDDTQTRKNSIVLSMIMNDSRFEVIEVSSERNGTAVVRRCTTHEA